MSGELTIRADGVFGLTSDRPLSTAEKGVLRRLCWKADDDGTRITISQTEIADDVGCTVKTVRRALKKFRAHRIELAGHDEPIPLLVVVHEEDRARKIPVTYAINVEVLLFLPMTQTERDRRERTAKYGRGARVVNRSVRERARGGVDDGESLESRGHDVPCDETATGDTMSPPGGHDVRAEGHGVPSYPNQTIQTYSASDAPRQEEAGSPPAQPTNQPDAGTPEADLEHVPIGAHFKLCKPRIREAMGGPAYRSWVEPSGSQQAIAEYDDGKLVVLSVGSKLMADFLGEQWGVQIAEIMGRKLVIVSRGRARFPTIAARQEYFAEVARGAVAK